MPESDSSTKNSLFVFLSMDELTLTSKSKGP